ncbi:acyl carrier protein [Lysobacter sp. P5_B9]
MEREDIFESLKELVSERFDLDGKDLTLTTTQSDLGIDSILMVDLMMDVEERLGVTFKDLNLVKNPTLGDIVNLVEANLGAKS